MLQILGLEDAPNPAYVLSKEEIRNLWEYLRHQRIPPDTELGKLVIEMGDSIDDLHTGRDSS